MVQESNMINKLKLIIILLLFVSSVIFSQWQIQESNVSVDLCDVSFVDSLRGWAIGDSATIIVTINGGETWKKQISPVDTAKLNKICFINENVGYIIANDGIILSTKNGGNTWEQQESGVEHHLLDLSFVNENIGWIVGKSSTSYYGGVILNTQNEGNTWKKQLQTIEGVDTLPYWIDAVRFLDNKYGWALGNLSFDNFGPTHLLRTIDGGKEWTFFSQIDARVRFMSIVTQDTIWVGEFGFETSSNGGLDWENSGGNWLVRDFAQIDGRTGWIIAGILHEGMKLFFKNDYGMNNTHILLPGDCQPYALSNIGSEYLWLVGKSGLVMRFKKQAKSVDPKGNPLPREFYMEQNYPNPFNSITNIRFSLMKKDNMTLTIYDICGRKIRILLSKTLTPDIYYMNWDGTDYNDRQVPSGIYFFELSSNAFSFIRKVMLIR